MYPLNPSIYDYAVQLHEEMAAKAERRRLIREHRGASADEQVVGPLTALRRAVGTALVKSGERIRGAGPASASAHLRPVR